MPYKYREIEKRLLILGFKKVRQKGSHVLFSNGVLSFPRTKSCWKKYLHWCREKDNKAFKNICRGI